MAKVRFNFSQLLKLSDDFRQSKNAIPVIVQRVLTAKLRELRNQLRALAPRRTGGLKATVGFTRISTSRKKGEVSTTFGLLYNRRFSASQIIRGNVMIHGGAEHGTRTGSKYLWIPLGGNRAANGMPVVSPREFLDSGGQVITSRAGNKIAIRRPMSAPFFLLLRNTRVGIKPNIPQMVEGALPEITKGIPELIAQVIEARRATIAALEQ